jgi:uncharacterized protein (DUF1800 family)
MDINAAIAFSRFGLGRRRGEPVPADPRAWLRAQIDAPDPVLSQGQAGISSSDALAMLWAVLEADKQAAAMGDLDRHTPEKQAFNAHNKAEIEALMAIAITTEAGFRERLVWFWANHFTIAARGRPAAVCAGPYIREAIRPYVTGRFRDMLLAVMHHPAMLAYLDQSASVGPESIVGERKHRGLNENLARECLELHTVTPAAGYTQQDVTNFARILTGFTIEMRQDPRGFRWVPNTHEPGEQTVMGRVWPDGEAGPAAILAWLADHPSTQRHLAEKLVRHFVSDDPSPADVAHIQAVLRNSGGDLGAASKALIALPGAWAPLTKLRTPQDYVVATMRAVGALPANEPQLPGMVARLGQPVFGAPFPIGWPDRAADWAGPEALLQRVDFAYQFAARVTDQEPSEVAENTLGPLLTAETLTEIRRAGSRQDGLTLLLSSPEFQRR